MKHVFKRVMGYDRDEGDRFFVNDKQIGYSNYDEHGSCGMESLSDLFESIAKEIGAEYIEVDAD